MSNLGIMPNSIAVGSFVCLERKRAEFYPSKDKAVLFFEVPNLKSALAAIEPNKVVHSESTWAVLHDPEGHNVRDYRPSEQQIAWVDMENGECRELRLRHIEAAEQFYREPKKKGVAL